MRYVGKCLALFFPSLFTKRICILGGRTPTGTTVICSSRPCEVTHNWALCSALQPPPKSRWPLCRQSGVDV